MILYRRILRYLERADGPRLAMDIAAGIEWPGPSVCSELSRMVRRQQIIVSDPERRGRRHYTLPTPKYRGMPAGRTLYQQYAGWGQWR